jgi:hypothetical protein
VANPAETLSTLVFTGYGLVLVTGGAFSYYALQNYAFDRMEGYEDFWSYLTYVGMAFATFGAFGLWQVAGGGNVVQAFLDTTLLFAIVFLTFSMREVYYNSALAPDPSERRVSLAWLRTVEFGFVVVIAVEWVVAAALGQTATTAVLRGLAALGFTAYGVAFSERLESLAHGTALDSLRRHLLVVLVCATGIAIADLVALVGPSSIASSTFYVFLVLLGGLLVPPTIRLQQSVAGLS